MRLGMLASIAGDRGSTCRFLRPGAHRHVADGIISGCASPASRRGSSRYDVSAIYGDVGPPQEISADYRYSFDTFHTDEGIDGHSMQFGWMGEGQAMGHALHQAYGRFLLGRDVPWSTSACGRTCAVRTGTSTT